MQISIPDWAGPPLEWGDVSSWVEALSTLGALWVAWRVFRYVKRTWDATKEQLALTQQTADAAQEQVKAAQDATHAARETAQIAKDQLSVAEAQTTAIWEQLKVEQGRDRDRQIVENERLDMDRRAQADQIAGWLTRGESVNSDLMDGFVVNTSQQPIYSLVVHIRFGDTTSLKYSSPTLPPSLPQWDVRLLFGLEKAEIELLEQAEANGQPFGVCFSFVDIHGRKWTRRWNGELVAGLERFVETPLEKSYGRKD